MRKGVKKEIQIVIAFTAAFLLGGFIHVALNPLDFTSCITQIYYSSLVLAWGITINYRIVDKRIRRLMLEKVVLIMILFFLQMCRYRIFEHAGEVLRYLWYGYYIPVNLIPVLFLFVVLHLNLQEDEKINRKWLLMLIPSAVFIILVMTNDFHQIIFQFKKDGSGKNGTYTHGVWFYIIYAWIIIVLGLSLYIAVKKSRIPSVGKKLWIPLYFSCYGILCFLSMLDLPKIADTCVWMFSECLAMVAIGIEESCIQLGLIPANSSYMTIYRLSDKPVIISDENGTEIYTSDTAKKIFQRKKNVQFHKKAIMGGSVSWAVDLTEIMKLNRKLEKAAASIESRNEYLRTENKTREEYARITARNMLYNQIAYIVSPQLEEIQRLIGKAREESSDESIAKIMVLNTYIKRRSNMELLKSELKSFPNEELKAAIRESCEHLKQCGVNAMLYITPDYELSADMQIYLYEAFETVLENSLDSLVFLLVNIATKTDETILRVSLKASSVNKENIKKKIDHQGVNVKFIEDENDEISVTLSIQEGVIKV